MKKCFLFICILYSGFLIQAQSQSVPRPKLVVGLMVDQMRWDFIYRYYDRYGSNGFKRLLQQGFNCENTYIPYAQTVTAVGHSTVYTGSVPAFHGIMGNEWYDKKAGRNIYCTEDKTVEVVGGVSTSEPMSPKNMWASSITDELKLATNFRSKTIGIALKDRGSILPAGHSADAAYWYESATGNWITSSYYMNSLPKWVNQFNDKKLVNEYYKNDWNTLFPVSSYVQSDKDNSEFEGKFLHEAAPVFPHELKSKIGKDFGIIRSTPFGNSFTLDFAKSALIEEKLGKDNITDFLAVSLSSPDYIGHQFGPNSIEIEDTYLRLDKEIANFMAFLDKEVGVGEYLLFLTADHAVAHNPGYLKSNKIAAGSTSYSVTELNKKLEEKFNIKTGISATANYQIYLNDTDIEKSNIDKTIVKQFIIKYLNDQPNILMAFDMEKIAEANLTAEVKEMFLKGYNTKRAGDVQVILKPAFFNGGKTGTTHGSWYPYDSHIPLLWMGWGVKQGRSNKTYYMTDIAATLAALLRIQEPNASIGKPITELMK